MVLTLQEMKDMPKECPVHDGAPRDRCMACALIARVKAALAARGGAR